VEGVAADAVDSDCCTVRITATRAMASVVTTAITTLREEEVFMLPIPVGRVLQPRMRFRICFRYARVRRIHHMRVLIVEDEPFLSEAIRDGLRLEAIAADIAGDGDTA